jgi:hypothetical protein
MTRDSVMKTPELTVKTFFFGRYGSLLITLMLLMVLVPLLQEWMFGRYLIEFLFVIVLIAGLRAIVVRKDLFIFQIALLAVSLILGIFATTQSHELLFALSIAGRILFMVLVALTILFDLFRGRKVTGDTLAGAVCVYLMIALIWGFGFLLIEFLVPGSFSFTQGHARMQLWLSQEFFPFFYFSLVTVTTVGYGDMAPVTTAAQSFATMEALLGQIYLTILVARLVGMYLMHQQNCKE